MLFIVLTIIKFFPISKISAYLLVPYLLWVSFASLLNFYIVKLN
ncbi:MAG: tryptophan-rich sensory protein [Microgenomates group bacterium]